MEAPFERHRSIRLNLPPNRPMDISFSDVTLSVPGGTFHRERKTVLKGLSGCFKSGELTAIMGPSGAGKSSLLNILSGFQVTGMSGVLKRGGQEGGRSHRRLSCYIMQDDRLNPLFTVVETMEQAADLKLGPSLSSKAKAMIIEDILETLGLAASRYTRCGNLSGGQKKRLSIGLELIDNPPVMYLDEPTTGLDSLSSVQLVTLLKSLARDGRSIICTIHQPAATIFEMMDQVYLIAEGQCLYQGASHNVVPFLQSVGLICPQYHNPADFLLDVVAGEFGDFTEHLALAAKDPSWKILPLSAKKDPIEPDINKKQKYSMSACILMPTPSEWGRIAVLLKRCALHLHRDWTSTYLKLGLHILVSIIFGLIFRNAGEEANKVISNLGFFMCSIVYMSFTSLLPAILKLPSELKVLKKEYFNNWYKFKTYYIAFLMVNLPLQMVFCLVYSSISYYMSHQMPELFRFLRFLFIIMLVVACTECLGLAFGSLTNPVNGVFLGSVLLAVILVFAGYLVLVPHMTTLVYYISYGSYMRYAFEAITVSLYGYGRSKLACNDKEIYCHLRSPEKVLEEMGMVEGNFWKDAGALGGFILFFGLISYYLLNRRIKSKLGI